MMYIQTSDGHSEIPEGIDTTNFDFRWRPIPYDRPYIHQFGTQHQKTGGPRYVVNNNVDCKIYQVDPTTGIIGGVVGNCRDYGGCL